MAARRQACADDGAQGGGPSVGHADASADGSRGSGASAAGSSGSGMVVARPRQSQRKTGAGGSSNAGAASGRTHASLDDVVAATTPPRKAQAAEKARPPPSRQTSKTTSHSMAASGRGKPGSKPGSTRPSPESGAQRGETQRRLSRQANGGVGGGGGGGRYGVSAGAPDADVAPPQQRTLVAVTGASTTATPPASVNTTGRSGGVGGDGGWAEAVLAAADPATVEGDPKAVVLAMDGTAARRDAGKGGGGAAQRGFGASKSFDRAANGSFKDAPEPPRGGILGWVSAKVSAALAARARRQKLAKQSRSLAHPSIMLAKAMLDKQAKVKKRDSLFFFLSNRLLQSFCMSYCCGRPGRKSTGTLVSAA